MLESAISDQKRLVRGEHWLAARKALRARDGVHHRAWRLLTIAGPAPHEEITSIRGLMHQAHITSVDIDEANVLKAIEAGADDAYVCDIGRVKQIKTQSGNYSKTLPPDELVDKKFDVISLDLTGPANEWLTNVVGCYYREALVSKGVMMVTLSYGRDVVEYLTQEWDIFQDKGQRQSNYYNDGRLTPDYPGYWNSRIALKDVPEQIAIRVWCALRTRCVDLVSCIQYRGGHMPMVACLLTKNYPLLGSQFKSLSPDDLEYALANEELNLSHLYATPSERIDAFRAAYTRKLAAYKAVGTRRLREGKELEINEPPLSRLATIEKLWSDCTPDERAEVWKILHRLYTERKTISLNDPDVRARAELMREIANDRADNAKQVPGAS